MQGLIKSFKPELEKRLLDPSSFDPEKHFQYAWSGDKMTNHVWAKTHGNDQTYANAK